eukprot:1162758-Amphidinium_carterae.1
MDTCSLPSRLVDQIVSTTPGFPTLSAKESRNACIRSKAVAHFKGNWNQMQRAWRSMLLQPGVIVHDKSSGKPGLLTLTVTAWGCIGIPVRIKK